jgi:membrane protein
MREAYRMVRQTIRAWREDEATRLGASLAYYSVFSMAPLLLIAVAIVGFFFGGREAESMVGEKLSAVVGDKAARALLAVAANLQRPSANRAAALLGLVILLVGASGVVGELKAALDRIWDVRDPPSGWKAYLMGRLMSLLVVLFGGALLLGSIVLGALSRYAGIAAGFLAVTTLIALLYKLLPDTRVRWAEVLPGAGATAAMLFVGNIGLGVYLRKSATMSAYGAAASLLLVLAWTYYSAQIFYFGAELTHVWAERRRSRVRSRSEGKRLSSS